MSFHYLISETDKRISEREKPSERERERDREKFSSLICVYVYTYIYCVSELWLWRKGAFSSSSSSSSSAERGAGKKWSCRRRRHVRLLPRQAPGCCQLAPRQALATSQDEALPVGDTSASMTVIIIITTIIYLLVFISSFRLRTCINNGVFLFSSDPLVSRLYFLINLNPNDLPVCLWL